MNSSTFIRDVRCYETYYNRIIYYNIPLASLLIIIIMCNFNCMVIRSREKNKKKRGETIISRSKIITRVTCILRYYFSLIFSFQRTKQLIIPNVLVGNTSPEIKTDPNRERMYTTSAAIVPVWIRFHNYYYYTKCTARPGESTNFFQTRAMAISSNVKVKGSCLYNVLRTI